MKISVNGQHVNVGRSLRDHIETKLTDVTEKYFPHPVEANVIISKDASFYRVEIGVHAKRGLILHSSYEADDAYIAFDKAADKMDKRLRRYKNKIKDHSKRAEAVNAMKINHYILSATDFDTEETEKAEDNPIIIAEIPEELNRMTVAEAVMQLDLTEKPVLLFKNDAHGELNMLYRRNDGNIGWVDPKNLPNH